MSAKDMFYPADKNFTDAEKKEFAREELVYNVTEDILVALEDLQMSKKELANRLGKSRAYVSQLLSGARNMTLGSLSDICFAIGMKPKINLAHRAATDIFKSSEHAWVNTSTDSNKNHLIRKAENVIHFQHHKEWRGAA